MSDPREVSRELRVLRINNALVAEMDLDKLVQLITDEATGLCRARFGAFFYNRVDGDGATDQLFTLSGAPRAAFERFGPPRATAVFGHTFRGQGPLRLDDVRKDPRYGHNAPHHGLPEGHLPVVSYLAVPVMGRNGDVIGGLFFGDPEPGRFTQADEDAVVTVAAQAAVALDNAQLLQRARVAEAQHSRLAHHAALAIDVSNALTGRDTLPEMLGDCCGALVNQLDAVVAIIAVVEGGALRLASSATLPPLATLPGAALRLPAVLTQELLKSDDVAAVPLLLDPAWALAQGIVGAVVVPLYDRDRPVGLIGVAGKEAFCDEDVDALVTVAGAISLGIVKKHALDATARRTRQLRALSEAALAIQATSSTDGTWQVIADQARHVLGTRQAVVVVGDDDADDNVAAASFADDLVRYADFAPSTRGGAYAALRAEGTVRLTHDELRAHPVWQVRLAHGDAHPPLRGLLSTPFIGRNGKRIGALQVSDRVDGDFEDDDVDAALQLARLGAVAIENLRLIHALERTNRELDQFAHVASHDLKAPLRGITHLTEWLENDLGTALPPESQLTLQKLRGRVSRMEVLIDALLHLSRVGRATSADRVGVVELIEDVIESLVPPPGVTIVVEPTMPVLWTERLALEQVLSNLIENAVRYGCPGGKGRIHIGGFERGGVFECFVSDDGPGIPKTYQHKVFEIFQRLDPRGPIDGAGIGLTVVKKIVESRGGKIWLEAGVVDGPGDGTGRGATFRLEWPARTRPRTAPAA